MEWTAAKGRAFAAAVVAATAALLCVNLSGFGIWDPWELNRADEARQLLNGELGQIGHPIGITALIAAGFSTMGLHEWAGRLPVVLTAIAAIAVAYFLVARFAGRRAGVIAAAVAATSPLFLFNGRQMLGEAPGFFAEALVGLCACCAVFWPRDKAESPRTLATILWLSGLVAAIGLAIVSRGGLLGVLPPLLAVSIVAILRGEEGPARDPKQLMTAIAVMVATAIVGFLVARDAFADAPEYSLWLGGRAGHATPAGFDVTIERAFHSFAPWSAILPLAIGHAVTTKPSTEPGASATMSLRLSLVLWAALSYAALTVFRSRYGSAAYVPVIPFACAVGLWLRDVEESKKAWPLAAIVVVFLTFLLIRDFSLYPGGPAEGLPVDALTVPEVFNPKRWWAVLLSLFALGSVIALAVDSDIPDPHLNEDVQSVWRQGFGRRAWFLIFGVVTLYRLVRELWARGWGTRAWLIAIGSVLAACQLFGIACLVAAEPLQLTTLVTKIGIVLAIVPMGVVLSVAFGRLGLWAASKLGRFRLAPMLLAAAAIAIYSAHGYLPALSAHFSPRQVYERYNELARTTEPLGEYRVGLRAAAYYARGEVREIASESALLEFLSGPDRHWAILPATELASINRGYRRRNNGTHLFIADARSATVMLATNQPLPSVSNQNPLVASVLREPPTIQHTRGWARFEDKLEFLGYDIELPRAGFVGASERFTITWYFRVLRPVPGSFKMFVHIDGHGLRLNGDHDPVNGVYPVRMWDEGDIIADRQELTVPANYRSGPYTIYFGFFSGSTRLRVVEGANGGENRVNAGTLMVR